jgi:hypothetical protein
MKNTWLEIKNPPAPYLHAFRRTTNRGLHIIIAIKQSRNGFQAYSIVDHGVSLKTIRNEREERDTQTIIDSIFDICDRYVEADSPSEDSTVTFSYIDSTGEIKGPASRNDLFDLVELGVIGWESQVWDSRNSSGNWESLNQAIGFDQIT